MKVAVRVLGAIAIMFYTQWIGAEVEQITMHEGDVRVIHAGDVERVAIGDDSVVNYRAIENDEMLLIAASAGETSLMIWGRGGRKQKIDIVVVAHNISKTLQQARSAVKTLDGISVREEGGVLIFEGELNAADQPLIDQILKRFPGSFTMIRPRAFDVKPLIRLDVQVVEMKKRATSQLGIRWQQTAAGPAFGVHKGLIDNDRFALATDDPYDPGVTEKILKAVGGASNTSLFAYGGMTSVLSTRIELLAENGEARILSQPKLSAKSGESSSFRSGGQFPIPVVDQFGRPSVDFKDYGITLDMTPTIDRQNNVNVKVYTEISSIDFAVQVNDIPGVTTRSTETTVNVQEGDTIVLSGLASGQQSEAVSKLPLLGDVPVIGVFFRAKDRNFDTTELIISITPYVITPDHAANQKLMKAGSEMSDYWRKKDLNLHIMD